MPATLNFPGVYIDELPSGVRTISGVATSITAFIGRALRGKLNEPTTISSFGDFERVFGGLWQDSTLGYAVRAYFQNGGSQAVVVRLFHERDKTNSTASVVVGGAAAEKLTLQAASPGRWGEGLRAAVDHDVTAAAAQRVGLPVSDLFNLTVTDTTGGASEVLRNVTFRANHPRNLTQVLRNESTLVVVGSMSATARPPAVADNVTVAVRALEDKKGTQKDIDDARAAQAASDGDPLAAADYLKSEGSKEGLFALLKTDLFNLLNIPPHGFDSGDLETTVISAAAKLCEDRRALLIVDPPLAWNTVDKAISGVATLGTVSRNAAVFFPRLRAPDLLRDGQLVDFAPGGAVAGVFARTDATRGVWKAPAGTEAVLNGVPALSIPLTDLEIGRLNPLGINCLRSAPAAGRVVWGARTREGDDRLASEWKYVPIRRLALFIEESLYRGTQWVVFEPNDEPLWAQIRLNLGAFMQDLFRQGAFQGKTPREAYFVKVDRETTTQSDINNGIVNILVGFAPLRPAEFVVIKIQQIAGSLAGA